MRKLQISLPDFRRLCIFKGVGLFVCFSIFCQTLKPLSGIYPREPRNKKKASKSSTQSTTFYYSKDIQYLLHEPLINKFRDHKALAKKIARFLGRGEVGDASRLERKGSSKVTLDHIIKERYPTFIDALRDLDDALSLLFLFANLPATAAVPPKTIALCQRLCLEFQHYLITTNSLRKSFLSIKGIYYQATVHGQDILWLVPYKFVQRITGDVDFRIMGTFVEFYTTLLGFVNFRLYNSIGLIYPPKFNKTSDEQGGELGAFTLEGKAIDAPNATNIFTSHESQGAKEPDPEIQKKADAIEEISLTENEMEQELEPRPLDTSGTIDVFEVTGEGADILPAPQISEVEVGALFAPFSFFLSRETPRQPLEFILRAFGCKRIGWDAVLGDGAFTHDEKEASITHQIVDRPPPTQTSFSQVENHMGCEPATTATQIVTTGGRIPGRTYIQPQWVWDCINNGKLLRPDLYAPGATLPPHLSPWVKPTKGIYDPNASLAEQEREGEAEEAEDLDEEDDEEKSDSEISAEGLKPTPEVSLLDNIASDPHGMEVANNVSDSDSESSLASAGSSFAGFNSDAATSEDEGTIQRTVHQRELEAEAAGLSFAEGAIDNATNGSLKPSSRGEEARKQAGKKRRAEEEELERRKMMMGRKKRKLLEKMLFSNRKKDEEAEKLRGKRRRIEAGRVQL